MESNKLSARERLKDIFTTNVIVRQKNKKLVASKVDINTDTFVDTFKRAFRSRYSKMNPSWSTALQQSNKRTFYSDYDQMDQDSIISSALDIFADECVLKFEDGDVLKIYCDDFNIQKILENLFIDVFNVEFNLWSWIRNLVKYGDFYIQPIMKEGYGIIDFELISVYDIERKEDTGELLFYYDGNTFSEFEIVHFRMLSDSNFFPYGRSMVEGGRKVWKQLVLLEDAMLIQRIMRAPEKRIYKIDVGNLPPESVNSYMETLISEMKKEPYVDENGNINLEFNLHNMMEDIYLPVRGGKSGTEVDTLSGLQYNGIEDIDYLRNKLLASIKVPQQFLNYAENNEGKATLSAMDLRFARTIERIQNVVLAELYNLAYIHLTLQGFDKSDLLKFTLELNNPSIVYQQEKLDFLKSKIEVARDLKELKMFSRDYIYENIFKLSDKEALAEKKKLKEDAKFEKVLSSIEDGSFEDGSGSNDTDLNDFTVNVDVDKEKDDSEEKEADTSVDDSIVKSVVDDVVKDNKPDKNPLKHNFKGGSALGI